MKKEMLGLLEQQAEEGHIDLYYGDEVRVSEEGYVPYGWQFDDEDVHIESARGRSMNYFGLLTRDNRLAYEASEGNIDSGFVVSFLDRFSFGLQGPTVVALDNARVHTAKKVRERFDIWQERGLYIFLLPKYSPHLNIIERLWKELKEGWLRPSDYRTADDLFYATDRALAAVGKEIGIDFSKFNENSN